MIISVLFSLFALEGAGSEDPTDKYTNTPGMTRFTIRRLMYAQLPEAYYELSENQFPGGMVGRHCFQKCLRDNKRMRGSCSFGMLEVNDFQFNHPLVELAPFEQRILRARVKRCWMFPEGTGEPLTETLAEGAWNNITKEEGRYVLTAFIIESASVEYPPEPWHPGLPPHIVIRDERMLAYLAKPKVFKCNEYISWPVLPENAEEDKTTTLSTQPDDSSISMVTKSVPTVSLNAHMCDATFVQRIGIRCAEADTTKLFDIILAKDPIGGCENVGIRANGKDAPSKTTDATQAAGWCVKNRGCGGAETAVGIAERIYGKKTVLLASGYDIEEWCYVFAVIFS